MRDFIDRDLLRQLLQEGAACRPTEGGVIDCGNYFGGDQNGQGCFEVKAPEAPKQMIASCALPPGNIRRLHVASQQTRMTMFFADKQTNRCCKVTRRVLRR